MIESRISKSFHVQAFPPYDYLSTLTETARKTITSLYKSGTAIDIISACNNVIVASSTINAEINVLRERTVKIYYSR